MGFGSESSSGSVKGPPAVSGAGVEVYLNWVWNERSTCGASPGS